MELHTASSITSRGHSCHGVTAWEGVLFGIRCSHHLTARDLGERPGHVRARPAQQPAVLWFLEDGRYGERAGLLTGTTSCDCLELRGTTSRDAIGSDTALCFGQVI